MWFFVLIPLLFGVACLFIDNFKRQAYISIFGSMLVYIFLVFLWVNNLAGDIYISRISLLLPGIFLKITSQGIGIIFSGITTILWISSLLFSLSYFNPNDNTKRYSFLMGITFTGILITFMAGDFLTLLLGFEMMSLASWGLVAHTQT